ncbi:MAG TPA: hypothetical protein VF805_02550 [Anaeromyxobacteraceae bacterium]
MNHLTRTKRTVLASVLAGLALAGCGQGGTRASTLSGVASTQAPLGGAKLTLKDSSTSPQQRTTIAATADGTFTFDVSGLRPPFMLQADWSDDAGEHHLRSVAKEPGSAHVDPLTESALAAAAAAALAQGDSEADDGAEHERTAVRVDAFLQQLRTALAPLFDLYGIGTDLLQADPTALLALLHDVSFEVQQGSLVVTNRATGAVIFTGPLTDLAAGTFSSGNLPAAPTTTIDGAAPRS